MAIETQVHFSKTVSSPRDLSSTFSYLSAFPQAATENFPGIQSLKALASDLFEWEFEEISYQSFKLVIKFLTRLSITPLKEIRITPVQGSHPGQLSGTWTLTPHGTSTEVAINLSLNLSVPGPSFLKSIVAPLAEKDILQLLERYASNVEKNLST